MPAPGRGRGPEAWLEIDPAFADCLDGIKAGSELLLLTWLHQARRDILQVHPRGNPDNPRRGVFATRSPDRPNPIGLHRVTVLELAGPLRLRVAPLEVLESTPLIDVKPARS